MWYLLIVMIQGKWGDSMELIDLYPEHYDNHTTREILKSEGLEIERELENIKALIREFKISTADISLGDWAKFAGIEDNKELSKELRRSNILAALKVKDITTVEVIKNIVESYSNATCEVIENFGEYYFTIRIVDRIGVPEKDSEIRKIIEKLKPAHLGFEFIYKYRTWGEVEDLGRPWYTYSSTTWADMAEKGVV